MSTNIFNFSKYLGSSYFAYLSNIKYSGEINLLLDDLNISKEKVVIPDQIHSNRVAFIDSSSSLKQTDGIITENNEIILSIKVADCVPIYILDSTNKIFGLVHSGWKGTVKKIIINALNLLIKNNSKLSEIKIFLGPSIGKCCYEVGKDIANYFHNTSKVRLNNNKWLIDIKNQIIIDLIEFGMNSKNINKSNICTFESYECHSYRRDGKKSGRMIALMGNKCHI